MLKAFNFFAKQNKLSWKSVHCYSTKSKNKDQYFLDSIADLLGQAEFEEENDVSNKELNNHDYEIMIKSFDQKNNNNKSTKKKRNSIYEDEEETTLLGADLRNPHLLFPDTRQMRRKFFLHVGPTNSGKTHSAIKRLSESERGVYCAPLRLLAAEIYDKLNNEYNVPCDLVTGQQIIETPDSNHVSCTIEMLNLEEFYDVAIIDEYQILTDNSRGWAWSRAILGLLAREIHLTGDPSKIELVRHMVELSGDQLEVIEYQRLSPLSIGKSLHGFKDVREGDAVIGFSRKEIYRLKQSIETATQQKCSIVYGNLPPEARKTQASSFNDPNGEAKILVGTDAIGMGLNLNIGRVIFSSVRKFDGVQERVLTDAEIKQIAGRAGRFNSIYPNGEVTAMYEKDLKIIKKALKADVSNTGDMQATLFPNYQQIEVFSASFPSDMPFSQILGEYETRVLLDKNFVMGDIEDKYILAKAIDHIPLSLEDRYLFIFAPVDTKHPSIIQAFVRYATDFCYDENVSFSPHGIIKRGSQHQGKSHYIQDLEIAFRVVELYIWLSIRFLEFVDLEKAETFLDKIEGLISKTLDSIEIPYPRRHFSSFLSNNNSRGESSKIRGKERRRSKKRDTLVLVE
jgi:ATP-dependent RNA helicase SUPV3L1/SUV3